MPTESSTPVTSTPTRNCISALLLSTMRTHDPSDEPRASGAGRRPGRLADADPIRRERWALDLRYQAGAQTIVDRRIGRNELSAIRTLLACVDAQHDYFDIAKQAKGSGEYATRLVSAPGRRDGLYWPVAEGETESPLGPLIDSARDAGYPGELVGGKPIPYEGYNFRILKAQGPNGDGGVRSYIRSGRMIGGFALIAWPAVFEASGIMTFIVGPDGDVYPKDLGPKTASIAVEMTTFDPDLTWSRVAVTND
jgi:Protein of unknown function (DUF2950)